MPVSEPLPHFVDDLLGYLHETHPTYAALDGVHTHDDLLEDLSKQGIEHDVRALSGYLRRLEEIEKEGLPEIEALEQRMCVWPQITVRAAAASKIGSSRCSLVSRVKHSTSLRGVPWQNSTSPSPSTSTRTTRGQLATSGR